MKLRKQLSVAGVLAAFCVPLAGTAWSQGGTATSYQVPERSGTPSAAPPETDPASGPVHLARFSYLQGDVQWRPDDAASWSAATVNLPLKEGAQITVAAGGRAEIQFDDGSELRLASGTSVTLKELYGDTQGEYTQITMPSGLAALHVTQKISVFQIDSPNASLQAAGPAQVRITADAGTRIAVGQGSVQVEDDVHQGRVSPGQQALFTAADAPLTVQPAPAPDDWDTFVAARDRAMTPGSESAKNLPAQLALVAGDLDAYGKWQDVEPYGNVWVPAEPSQWLPYHDGRWIWVETIGWTWVGQEAWGWAPYHYGTWLKTKFGWAWVPGPDGQYWSPAIVDITDDNGKICWTPWAPWEVAGSTCSSPCYGVDSPCVDCCSIPGIAVFNLPSAGYVHPRPWHNPNQDHPERPVSPHPTMAYTVVAPWVPNFIPANARAGGGTHVRASDFSSPPRYEPVKAPEAASDFLPGHEVTATSPGGNPVGGPAIIPPPESSRPMTQAPLQEDRPHDPLSPLPTGPDLTTRWADLPAQSPAEAADHARADVGAPRLSPQARTTEAPSVPTAHAASDSGHGTPADTKTSMRNGNVAVTNSTAITDSTAGTSTLSSTDMSVPDDAPILFGGILVHIGSRLGAVLSSPAASNADVQQALRSGPTASDIRDEITLRASSSGHSGGHDDAGSSDSGSDGGSVDPGSPVVPDSPHDGGGGNTSGSGATSGDSEHPVAGDGHSDVGGVVRGR